MNNPPSPLVIIVDDDQAMRDSLSDYFYHANYAVKAYSNGKDMLLELNNHHASVIICDLKMPNMDGMSVLKNLHNKEKKPPLIMVTAHGNISIAVEAIKNGAYDFIAKPFNPKDLQKMVDQAINKHQSENNKKNLKDHPLGGSETIKAFHNQLHDYASTADNILIVGEQGVGKLLVAKTLHQHSQKNDLPFIHVNCNLVSKHFFEKIFLGSDNIFNRSKNGFVFLENLNKIPLESRAKLLKLLEKNKQIGLNTQQHNIPRFICSVDKIQNEEKQQHTNLNKLCALLGEKILHVPALREHKNDIFELFNSYMAQSANHYQASIPPLSKQDVIALSSFNWPGNQYQLRKIAEQFVLLNRTIDTSISHLLKVSPTDMVDTPAQFNKNLRTLMQDFECQLITQAMIECSGNISQVCDLLKIPRRTLNEKLLKYDMHRSSFLQH